MNKESDKLLRNITNTIKVKKLTDTKIKDYTYSYRYENNLIIIETD